MKEAYYFSHDCNARHDPKITAMRGVYGSEGYGWYWMLIEMMREAEEYRLSLAGKYAFSAFAMQLQSESNRIESFVSDCINEFELFETDGETFWSPSLLRRMEMRDQTSAARRKAAKARWDKEKKEPDAKKNADAKQDESKTDANAMQGKESKEKVKEKKEKESKEGLKVSAEPAPVGLDERDKLNQLIQQCDVQNVSAYTLDQIYAFIGVVEYGVLEAAVKKASDKHVNYALRTLEGWAAEGKTRTADVMPVPAVGERKQPSRSGRTGRPELPIVSNDVIEPTAEEMTEYMRLAENMRETRLAAGNTRGG